MKKFKIAFFDYPHWAIGKLNEQIAKRICDEHAVLDWSKQHESSYIKSLLDSDYVFLTSGPGLFALHQQYKIPPDRIYVVSHDEDDFANMQNNFYGRGVDLNDVLCSLRGLAVPSIQHVPSMLGKRIFRIPDVIQYGIDVGSWKFRERDQIETVGACGAFSRPSNTTHPDCKRGYLIEKVAKETGLTLATTQCKLDSVVDWFDRIDLNMVAGVFEGGPLSPYEAAACGIPTIGTSAGSWIQLVHMGAGCIVPYSSDKFIRESVKLINYYRNNLEAYREMSHMVREEVQRFDWRHSIHTWVEFFENPSSGM